MNRGGRREGQEVKIKLALVAQGPAKRVVTRPGRSGAEGSLGWLAARRVSARGWRDMAVTQGSACHMIDVMDQ